MSHQTVIVLDFGGQYNQLIARRVRECGVYCEVKPYTTPLEQIRAIDKRRLKERMGELDAPSMSQANNALEISFGLS